MQPENNSANAAYALVGVELANNWRATRLMSRPQFGTGGTFSVAYEVHNGTQRAFLKALNFDAFFKMNQNRNFTTVLKEYIDTYEYEKNVLNRCRNKRLSKVATILDEGQAVVHGYPIPQVPYLIFEMAEGDLRSQLGDFTNALEVSWKLRSLHNIAVGLKQLHSVKISHQDLKPSNVLVFDHGNVSKVGDLGRSLCQDIVAPHDNDGRFAGDANYAPPEAYYGYHELDWRKRTQQVDLYMFGNLAAFYFTGATLTALTFQLLDHQFQPMYWHGNFGEVKGYVVNAFYQAISLLSGSITGPHAADLLALIEDCSHADPDLRGRNNKRKMLNSLPFDSIVSRLDLMARKAEFNLY